MSEPNECPRLMEVHRLWEDDLGPLHAAEVRRHMEHCSSCRAEYGSWNRLSGLLARGDLAQPLVPERRRLMREKLLEQCAASLHDEHQAAPGRITPSPRAQPWWTPVRISLALAPLAAALLLLYAGRSNSPTRRAPIQVGLPHGAAAPGPKRELPPRQRRIASADGPERQLVQTHPMVSPRAGKRISRSLLFNPKQPGQHRDQKRLAPTRGSAALERLRRTQPPEAAQARHSPRRHGRFRVADTSLPPGPAAPRLVPAPRPIERLVIQVDPPRTARPAETGLVTHLTVIAAGNLNDPGATLTVVKSQKEEALP